MRSIDVARLVGIAALAGCFDPRWDNARCGAGGTCPERYTCGNDGLCRNGAQSSVPDASIAAAIDGGAGEAFCAAPGVIACYEFEGDARDGSGHALDSTMTNVAFAPGRVGMAMKVNLFSQTDVADSPLFNVAAVTMEAWIQPSALPDVDERAYGMDVDGQYGWYFANDGTVVCSLVPGAEIATDNGRIVPGSWTHVACTYDGSRRTLYVDGAVVRTLIDAQPLRTSGNTGMSLGVGNNGPGDDRMAGLIDQVRLFSVARTAAEICIDAGQASCL